MLITGLFVALIITFIFAMICFCALAEFKAALSITEAENKRLREELERLRRADDWLRDFYRACYGMPEAPPEATGEFPEEIES